MYLISSNNIEVSPSQWIYFNILSLFGLLILYSVWYIFMTILLWQSHLTNLNDLLSHIMDTAKYPTDMYENLGSIHFYIFIPFVLAVTLPAKKILFGRASFVDITILMITSICLFSFSRFFGVLLSALIPARVVDPSSRSS